MVSVHSHVQTLFRSESIHVSDYVCTRPRSTQREIERNGSHELVFVRRGAFSLRTAGTETVMTPNRAMVLPAGSEFAIDHPVHGGDECVIVAMDAALFYDTFRARAAVTFPATDAAFLAQHRVVSAVDGLEAEEEAFALIQLVGADFSTPREIRDRRSVRIALELLSARFTEKLPLSFIAREAGVSPWHLSRSFRRETGQSLHRYQNRLRLRAALRRLFDGEDDLTAIALDHGYFDHSHFTNAFRRAFGVAPSKAKSRKRSSISL